MSDKKLIKTTGAILVNKNMVSVFNFFADPGNDKLWRKEINESTLDGALQAGVKVAEYSYLSKKAPNNLVELVCVQFDTNKKAVFETPGNAPFYEKSERLVRAVDDNTTEVTYTLTFDKGIVKFALGFSLPRFIITYKTGSDMRKYLRQLKKILEKEQ